MWKKSRILVTGGDGFIGKYTCSLLSKNLHDVIAVDKHFTSPVPYQSIVGDLTDREFLASLFKNYSFGTIVHLASMLNTASCQQPWKAMKVNIGVSLNLLELATQFKIARFIYGSSISAYGPRPFSYCKDVFETDPAVPNNVYGISKRYVEVVGEAYQRQTALQFLSLRIASVVGAGARSPSSRWRSELFDNLNKSQAVKIHIPYSIHEIIPLVYVEDVAEMIKRLVMTDHIGHTIYNTPSESWKFIELAKYINGLNKYVQFTYGKSTIDDIPKVINGQRFIEEFGYNLIPLRQRLRSLIDNI